MTTYEVSLTIFGAIKSISNLRFQADKELESGSYFESNVFITNHSNGINISVTVRAQNSDTASKLALLFVGKMLDVLAFKVNTPLVVTFDENLNFKNKIQIRAILDDVFFKDSFILSRELNLNELTLLRSLSWYRKGLNSEDPFDKFLAYWNSISILASKYHTKNDRTKLGIKNQIWDCFITLWGNDLNLWEYIEGDKFWIDDNNELRDEIAHGLKTIDAKYADNVISRLQTVKEVSYKFITGWAKQKLQKNLIPSNNWHI